MTSYNSFSQITVNMYDLKAQLFCCLGLSIFIFLHDFKQQTNWYKTMNAIHLNE